MPSNDSPASGPVTMDHVAQRAGVSLMTVSRALRAPATVAEATRERIQAAISELNYVGSAFAGQLATGRTRLIAVVLPDLRNTAFALEMQGLTEGLGSEYQLVVAGAPGAGDSDEQVFRSLLAYRPAALVIHGAGRSPGTRDYLARCGVPVVELGSLDSKPINIAVGYANRAAGKAAAEHLLATGRRVLGFVSPSKERNARAHDRWLGFRDALKAAGVAFRPELELETVLGYERGAEALVQLLQIEPKLQGVFFTGDGWAIGALLHCQRQGIAVPRQLGIMGFDDQELAGLMVPSLSSIQVPRYEMGKEAGTQLRLQLAGETRVRKRVDLGFKLVVRGSTAPARS
ncbi:LacI family DNA-binding transcriptional regulator [Variovorax sp. KK3]|uniref:LacI family DNA-binding transcriptional regulator n=1 Tax=Variovorax sp. KK3 TaxID=1855728 RepID=UPI00097BA891|nr:LacI family DNA-binding transcriptional regulator [Variovorax sp. KK3]